MRTLLGAMTVSLLLSGTAYADDGDDFIGFWEGMDPGDGSDVTVSIRDLDDDEVLEFSWRESSWSFCNNTERALISGTATVDDEVMTSTDATLECFEKGFKQVLCFGFGGEDCDGTIPGDFELTLNEDNDVLHNPDDPGSVVLHRLTED